MDSSSLRNYRVLIAHDWFVSWAGSERCVEQMLNVFPQAELVTSIVATSLRDRNAVTRRARETWISKIPGARKYHRWFLPVEGLGFATLDTRKYDLIISSSHAFAKMIRKHGNTRHVCYCYSPPRYLWDLRQAYWRDANSVQRAAMMVGAAPLRWLDRLSARGVDRFVGISTCVADRIKRSYKRHADVVFPPVAAKPDETDDKPVEQFLLSLGRLVPYKRVDLAIRAAELTGTPLVVAGDGPDRSRLESLAGKWTTFVGEVTEQEAGRLMSTCQAFIFCGEEDFGIAPVEANAHGRPVIAFARGGLLDTMIPDVTAILFEEQTVDSVAAAIQRALSRSWPPDPIKRNAARFSEERFRSAFARIAFEELSKRSS